MYCSSTMTWQIVLLIALLSQPQDSFGQDPTVTLPNGQIVGRQDTTAEDKAYYAFEKIPYAAPPLADLRFRPPQPVQNWEGVLNATTLDVACYQLNNRVKAAPPGPDQSEDCLYINVFTPKLPSEGDPDLLPVMLFIHGGGFIGGSAANNPPDLFIDKDVILVTINYRLGVFGFISTQDEVIPGNNGLKDQLAALRWNNQNIHLFGGDPARVTIFGQSAGAGSVAHLTLNQDSAGLYQGAILQSGTFLCTGMFQRNSRQIAFGTGATIDPTFETSQDSQALLDLLSGLTADELNDAASQYAIAYTKTWDNFLEVGSIFAPVIEATNPDAFLTDKMHGLLAAGNVVQVPVLMGYNSEEKLGMTDATALVNITAVLDANLDYLTPADMQIADLTLKAEEGALIRDIYTGGEPFSDHLGDAVRFSSDNFLTRSMGRHAELLSQFVATFLYMFSHQGSIGAGPGQDIDADGVPHGGEMNYLFCSGTSCHNASLPEADLLTRDRIITLWTNFAKYQNPTPTPDTVLQNITWPAVSTELGDFYYLNIDTDLLVENHPKGDRYTRWVGLYNNLNFTDFDTF